MICAKCGNDYFGTVCTECGAARTCPVCGGSLRSGQTTCGGSACVETWEREMRETEPMVGSAVLIPRSKGYEGADNAHHC